MTRKKPSTLEERLYDLITQSSFRYRGNIHSGTTKYWLPDSRRCRKQQAYAQLVELATNCSGYKYNEYNRWKRPPPGLGNVNTIIQFASSRSYHINDNCELILTGGSNPAFMEYIYPTLYYNVKEKEGERRAITHKSMEIDPYDACNQVMKFSFVMRSEDRKYYAISSQGALVVMEKVDDQRIIITGICSTRAVPSSVNAKLFTEFLVESNGEILLVFLIYKESMSKVADEIEVFRFDLDILKLVKVDSLQGSALCLKDDYYIWFDSKKVGCKGDCVYFTGGKGSNRRWRVYDMKNGSVSDDLLGMDTRIT